MVALQDTVAVPDPVILLGVIVPQVRPDGTTSVRLTTPAKWLIELIEMVDVTEAPALAGAGEDAAIPKS
jgi:hypothetical protein